MKDTSFTKKIVFALFVTVLAISPIGVHFANAQIGQPFGIASPFGGVEQALVGIVKTIISLPLYLSAWVLYISGIFLNAVLQYTVLNLASNISQITGINIAWSVIRDLANITFIFMLLYIAIGTILNLNKVNWKKTLTLIIIAAVLINFSLLFTKLIIDASNIVAIFFYQRITPNATQSIFDTGLANSYMQPLGLTSIFNPVQGGNVLNEIGGDTGNFLQVVVKYGVVTIAGSAFFLITAFVFLSASILFLIRFIVFIFLLILSPIMVLGGVLPKIGDYAQKWWKALLDNAIFAPVFMILTYVVIIIIQNGSFLATSQQFQGANGVPSTLSGLFEDGAQAVQGGIWLLLNFLIVIVFAIGTLIISKQFSSHGGSMGEKFAGKVLGGGGGFVTRQTIGRFGKKLAESDRLKATENADRWYTRLGARAATGTGRYAAKSSFDVRGSTIGKGIAKQARISMGDAQKGGVEASDTRVREFFGRPGTKTFKERAERVREAQTSLSIKRGAQSGASPAHIDEMHQTLLRMGPKEVENLRTEDLKHPEIIRNITPQQLEAIVKSDKFTETEKFELLKVRHAPIVNSLAPGYVMTPDDKALITSLSTKELEMLDPSILTNPTLVGTLRQSQVDDLMKSDRFTPAQKKTLREERVRPIINNLAPGGIPADARDTLRKINPKDLAKMFGTQVPTPTGNVSLLLHPEVLEIYTPKTLTRMADELTPAQINDMKTAIMNAATMSGAVVPPQLTNLANWINDPDKGGTFFS